MKNLTLIMGLYFIVCPNFAMAEISVQHTDAEILGVLSMIDQNEIQTAQLAEQKNINHNVLEYARMVDTEHNKHLDKTRELSQALGLTIENNDSLHQLRIKGEQDLAALTVLDGIPFDQLYVADTIKYDSEALDWLDIQDAQNEQIRKFIQETKQDMTTHFKDAQKIQGQQQIGQT